MRLIIIRHGESTKNAQGIILGQLSGKLSKTGIEQSKKLAERLKKEKIDIIYSSDLNRAIETTKEIARLHPNTPIKYTKNLRERSFGKMEGKIKNDYKNHSQLVGIETDGSLLNRTKLFLNEIRPNKSILIVTHGGIVGAVMANLLNKQFKEIFNMGYIKNASITLFDPIPNLKLFNCTKHLA